jgi:hypothetical protein
MIFFRRDPNSARRRQAEHYADTIRHELTRLKVSARMKDGSIERVHFLEPLILTHDDVWLPLDLQRLPLGIDTNRLRDENVVQSLEDRCNAPVRVDTLPNGKLCYVVRVGAGVAFPEIFPIGAFDLPADAPPLAIPLGIDGQGDHRWVDLTTLPHLLCVGATKKGKSNFVHVLLGTLVARNTADDVELWLADHKGGVELDRYGVLMGKRGQGGIVRRFSRDPRDTLTLLQEALKELQRRTDMLRQAGASDREEYGRVTGQYLKPIVLLIDEIFPLMLDKSAADPSIGGKRGYSVSGWAEHLFAQIASLGRAPGIHLAIFTQKTGKDVLTGLITANFESRLVLSVADQYQSIYILGKADAVGMPVGRAIWREDSGKTTILQTPRITPPQIKLLLSRISRYGPDGGLGKADEARRFRDDAKLLLQVSCDHLDGNFSRPKLLAQPGIKGVISADRYNEIAPRLERDGVIINHGRGKARRVATAFMGRTHLLDGMYGVANDAPTTPPAPQRDTPPPPVVGSQSDAEKQPDVAPDQPVGCMDGEGEIALPDDDPDVELPRGLLGFLDGLEEE